MENKKYHYEGQCLVHKIQLSIKNISFKYTMWIQMVMEKINIY